MCPNTKGKRIPYKKKNSNKKDLNNIDVRFSNYTGQPYIPERISFGCSDDVIFRQANALFGGRGGIAAKFWMNPNQPRLKECTSYQVKEVYC